MEYRNERMVEMDGWIVCRVPSLKDGRKTNRLIVMKTACSQGDNETVTDAEVSSLMLKDVNGKELRMQKGNIYADRDRASLNAYARGAITLEMALSRMCRCHGWHHSEIDIEDFRSWVESLGYSRGK